MRILLIVLGQVLTINLFAQAVDTGYVEFRAAIVSRFEKTPAGTFGHTGAGVTSTFDTDQKILALTFDACGGPTGSAYDEELISLLQAERIRATLFLTGSWIDAHPELVLQLSRDTLFEIENHGLDHCPCSISGRERYGIRGTENVGQVVDEIELNARKIQMITHRKPIFYRSATGSADEACGQIARALGEGLVSYTILPGDAGVETPPATITSNLVRHARKGGIVIMHMNHPERNAFEGLRDALPQLKKMGYRFVKLEDQALGARR